MAWMPEDPEADELWQALLRRTRLRGVAEYLLIAAVALSGWASAGSWPFLFAVAVSLLLVSDRGQHRVLAERFEDAGRAYVAALSIGAHLVNNVLFCALAFGFGRIMRVFWVDLLEGRAGAWIDLVQWSGLELAIVGMMQLLWWISGRRVERGRWW
jgi:hypothetical protein